MTLQPILLGKDNSVIPRQFLESVSVTFLTFASNGPIKFKSARKN